MLATAVLVQPPAYVCTSGHPTYVSTAAVVLACICLVTAVTATACLLRAL
jgi:hypothetical protein